MPASSTTLDPTVSKLAPDGVLLSPNSPPAIAAGPGETFQVAISRQTTSVSTGQLVVGRALFVGGVWRALLVDNITPAQEIASLPSVATNPRGDRLLVWYNAGDKTVRTAFAPASSTTFGPEQLVPAVAVGSGLWPQSALDDQGNGVIGWSTAETGMSNHGPASAIGFDTAPPTITSALIPPTASATFPAPFSATATDVWSTPHLSWSFGDGATADGGSVQHAYESPNSYTATVTATDDAGNSSSQSGGVAVTLGDRDRDGVLSDKDCNDDNPNIRPGIRDIPGDGIDQNCDGADAKFLTLPTTVRFDWVRTGSGLRVSSLGVRGVKQGDTIIVKCTGRGCKRKKYTLKLKKAPKHASASLDKAAKGALLRAGVKLTVSVSRQDYSTRITTWTVRPGKGPKQSVRCQIPGAKKTITCA